MSTLAAESQAALDGLRHMEWMSALLAQCVYSEFSLEEREEFISPHLSVLMVDCKSVFDHLNSQGCPSSVSDKVAALDLVAIRSHLRRLGVSCRWIPTRIQLADSLTKNDAEAIDAALARAEAEFGLTAAGGCAEAAAAVARSERIKAVLAELREAVGASNADAVAALLEGAVAELGLSGAAIEAAKAFEGRVSELKGGLAALSVDLALDP